MQSDPARLRKAGLVLLILWAVIFACGVLGELLDIEALRKLTDFKEIFLR